MIALHHSISAMLRSK